eukprot:snap_masked-scaffold_3-processed-gene-16.30-mRNA-1 protein AED:1.00 eAED:1.00 QI:0/0/0/0/1/1/2/0/71
MKFMYLMLALLIDIILVNLSILKFMYFIEMSNFEIFLGNVTWIKSFKPLNFYCFTMLLLMMSSVDFLIPLF